LRQIFAPLLSDSQFARHSEQSHKWSLLVVRDLLRGNVTYGELQNSPEGIPTNILADRLKRLEEAGLIAKSAYQEHPVRYAYELTEKGKSPR